MNPRCRCVYRLSLSFVVWTAAAAAALSAGGPPPSRPVMRETNDRDADLIEALIDHGLLDEAEKICDDELTRAVESSDDFARWSIRLARVLTQRQVLKDDFDDASVKLASEPITRLLTRYPDHARRLFLRVAGFEIRWAAARHDIVVAAIQPAGGDREQRAIQRIAKLSGEGRALIDEIDQQRSAAEVRRDKPKSGLPADLMPADLLRLGQELHVMLVSIQLLQSDLFAVGSQDYIAAATAALTIADQAIARMPADCAARREIDRMRVLAMLRGGDPRSAKLELAKLETELLADANDDPRYRAIHIQMLVDSREFDAARRLIDDFYGESAVDAPKSIEMDLSRLSYLLAAEDPGVGAWLERIGDRAGEYARRRAEAIALRQLRSGPLSSGQFGSGQFGSGQFSPGNSTSAVAPALVAAQGKDWLRRGDRPRAAQLLAAAARAESDHDQALKYAQESAAVLVSIDRHSEAWDLLAELANAKRESKIAAAVQLQVAVLAQNDGSDQNAHRIEKSLRDTIALWPRTESAKQARRWLSGLLDSQGRFVEAAELLTHADADRDQIYQSWRRAFHTTDDESIVDVSHRFISAMQPLLQDESNAAAFRSFAVMFLDRDVLTEVLRSDAVGSNDSGKFGDPFIRALAAFRQYGNFTPALSQTALSRLTDGQIEDVRWRLRQDGFRDPSQQKIIARVMASWKTENVDSLGRAIDLTWNEKFDESMAMIRRLVGQSEAPGTQLRAAAEMLGQSQNPIAISHAIELWDELAAGLSKRSVPWHQAKLSAIELVDQLGRSDDAAKRSRYILLTSPPQDDAILASYESFANRK